MPTVTWDHIHLRSPDPEATAQWFERMLGAEVIRTTQQGKPRIDLKLGGAKIFIAAVAPGDGVNPPPQTPYQGLDHFAFFVTELDQVRRRPQGQGRRVHPGPEGRASRHPHLLPAWAAGRLDRAPGARSENRLTCRARVPARRFVPLAILRRICAGFALDKRDRSLASIARAVQKTCGDSSHRELGMRQLAVAIGMVLLIGAGAAAAESRFERSSAAAQPRRTPGAALRLHGDAAYPP